MESLVIYDSQYGNTEKVAQAIVKSIASKAVLFSDVKIADLKKFDLLIIGSPTQGGRPTVALQEFLDKIPHQSLAHIKVAAFDTRFREEDLNLPLRLLVKTIGFAAPKIAKTLVAKGGELIVPAEGFIVKKKEGPLADEELQRAAKWGKTLL